MYKLRTATPADVEPMMAIGHEGLRPHVEKVRRWVQEDEVAGFLEHFDVGKVKIIEVDGEDAGYIKVDEHPDHAFLDGIYIASKHRSKGLGASVIRNLISDSAKPIRLRVYRSNPAQRLYLRLGFVVTGGDKTGLIMEIKPHST